MRWAAKSTGEAAMNEGKAIVNNKVDEIKELGKQKMEDAKALAKKQLEDAQAMLKNYIDQLLAAQQYIMYTRLPANERFGAKVTGTHFICVRWATDRFWEVSGDDGFFNFLPAPGDVIIAKQDGVAITNEVIWFNGMLKAIWKWILSPSAFGSYCWCRC